jgi:hypothetical protein
MKHCKQERDVWCRLTVGVLLCPHERVRVVVFAIEDDVGEDDTIALLWGAPREVHRIGLLQHGIWV